MFELVRRIAEMAATEDLIRCARPHASAVVAALAAAPSTQDALLVEAATLDQGLDRLLFLVLLNEAVTLTDDPALEHLLAFWTASITRSPADPVAAFASWRDEHAGMLAHEQPPAVDRA